MLIWKFFIDYHRTRAHFAKQDPWKIEPYLNTRRKVLENLARVLQSIFKYLALQMAARIIGSYS